MKLIKVKGLTVSLNNLFLGWLLLYLAVGMLTEGLINFAVVAVHELSHLLTARRLGEKVQEIELLPFGGVARLEGSFDLSPKRECLIAAAGPAANLLLIILALALRNYGFWSEQYGLFFIQVNALVCLFNLLPALPLDGGRIYRAFRAEKIGLKKATDKAALSGQLSGLLIFLAGLVGLYYHVIGLDIIVSGLFLLYAATRERRAAPFIHMRYLNNKKYELAVKGWLPVQQIVALESMPLRELLEAFLPQTYHLVQVVDEELNCQYIVTESELIAALFTCGVEQTVAEAAQAIVVPS